MLNFSIHILILGLLSATVNSSNQLCLKNGTAVIRVPTIKTRQVIKKPTGLFRIFKKTKVYTDQYQDFEELTQTTEGCCEGYVMSEANECIPVCANDCPHNAKCMEPNHCVCNEGFMSAVSSEDGSHYCEPICEGGCPDNARCAEPSICECERGYHRVDYSCQPVCDGGCEFGGYCIQPNQCQCLEGYEANFGSCIPVCTAGDGCRNGRCVDKDQCVCNRGFELIQETQLCEPLTDLTDSIENAPETTVSVPTTIGTEEAPTSLEDEEEEEIYNKNLDKNEKIYLKKVDRENVESTTNQDCPPNFILFENSCRPQMFSSNEIDCRFKACPEHAKCQANGTCACIEGYAWFSSQDSPTTDTETTQSPTPSPNQTRVCMTLAEINERMEHHRLTEVDEYSDINWVNAFFIALGAVCVLGALCYLIIRILRPVKGKMDVEAESNMHCTYDKNYSETHYVL